MTEQNEQTISAASVIKRTIRKMLLVVFALPALLMGVLMALPYILDDPTLAPDDAQQSRALMMMAGSIVATLVVHLLTKSWGRSNGN